MTVQLQLTDASTPAAKPLSDWDSPSTVAHLLGSYAVARRAYTSATPLLSTAEQVLVGESIALLALAGFHNEALSLEQYLDSVQTSKTPRLDSSPLSGRGTRR